VTAPPRGATAREAPPSSWPAPGRRVAAAVACLAATVAVLVLATVAATGSRVSGAEEGVFHALNGHTVLPFLLVWPVMQAGSFIAIPLAGALALVRRRFRLSGALVTGGVAAYVLAKVVKHAVTRPRPGGLVPDVHLRGASAQGLGYPSGHAATVTLLAVLAWPHLGRRGRWVVGVLVAGVCLARVYVGAHLPLDVVGGAALGGALGLLLRPLAGWPRRRTEK